MAKRFYDLFREGVEELTELEALHLADILKESDTPAWNEVMMSTGLFWKIIDAGDHCRTWGKPDEAMRCFRRAQAMAEQMTQRREHPEDRRNLCVSCQRRASILRTQGDLDGAKEPGRKSLAVTEQLVSERGTPRDRRALGFSYHKIAGVRRDEGDLAGAREFYETDLRDRLPEELTSVPVRELLGHRYEICRGLFGPDPQVQWIGDYWNIDWTEYEWLQEVEGGLDGGIDLYSTGYWAGHGATGTIYVGLRVGTDLTTAGKYLTFYVDVRTLTLGDLFDFTFLVKQEGADVISEVAVSKPYGRSSVLRDREGDIKYDGNGLMTVGYTSLQLYAGAADFPRNSTAGPRLSLAEGFEGTGA